MDQIDQLRERTRQSRNALLEQLRLERRTDPPRPSEFDAQTLQVTPLRPQPSTAK